MLIVLSLLVTRFAGAVAPGPSAGAGFGFAGGGAAVVPLPVIGLVGFGRVVSGWPLGPGITGFGFAGVVAVGFVWEAVPVVIGGRATAPAVVPVGFG